MVRFSAQPLSFPGYSFDASTTSAGFLDGQQNWTTSAVFAVSLITGTVNSVRGAFPNALGNSNEQSVGLAGFDPTQPWTLTTTFEFHPVADAGGTINLGIGTRDTAQYQSLQLTFDAGDGAADQIATVAINTDGDGAASGPFAFPADAVHTLVLHSDGTTLTSTINGNPGPTIAANNLATTLAKLSIDGIATNTSDRYTFRTFNLVQS